MSHQSSAPVSAPSDTMALLRHRERQIAALHRVGEALFARLGVEELLRETLVVAVEVLEADAGSLQTYDPQSDCLVFRYVASPSDAHLVGLATPVCKGIAGRVFRTGTSDLTAHVQECAEFNPDVDQKSGRQTQNMLTVPLKSPDGRGLGVVQVLNAREGFDTLDLEVLEALATQAALAIETARLANQARRAEIVNVVGHISHDIKNLLTPLQSGVWTLETLVEDAHDTTIEVCHRYPADEPWVGEIVDALTALRADSEWIVASAIESAERIQAFTRDLADVVKGELAPPNFQTGDFGEVAREVVRSLQLVADKAGVALQLDIAPDLPVFEFDRKQLYSALYNLTNNALPETPTGGRVTIRTRCDSTAGVRIEVQDTGRGIPEEVRRTLFTDAAFSTKPGGTGLGTRIVADVVQRHGGTIMVESEEGQGSTFSIRLPLRQPTPQST